MLNESTSETLSPPMIDLSAKRISGPVIRLHPGDKVVARPG